MNAWVKSHTSVINIIIALLIIFFGLLFVEIFKDDIYISYYETQKKAAKIMSQSLAILNQERMLKEIPMDKESDPNQTGIIGMEFTQLTTTLGNLSAKRTSTNPDFAALMVRFFQDAKLTSGDFVAIGASGSFPGLIIATLSACQAMEITPLVIYSIGASEYGANIVGFTFIEMLQALNKEKIFPYPLLAVSMGGDNDQARGMFYPESEEIIRQIAEQSGVPLIYTSDLRENIQQRMELYDQAAGKRPIKCFVNIGGNSANYGTTIASLGYPNGLVWDGPEIPRHEERGLIFEFQTKGIPVIHLLDIIDLAVENSLPVDPIPLPVIGVSNVYKITKYPRFFILFIISLEVFFLYQVSPFKRRFLFLKKGI